MIFGLEIVVAARVLNVIGVRGIVVAVMIGSFVLMLLSMLIGGTSPFDVAFNAYNFARRPMCFSMKRSFRTRFPLSGGSGLGWIWNRPGDSP